MSTAHFGQRIGQTPRRDYETRMVNGGRHCGGLFAVGGAHNRDAIQARDMGLVCAADRVRRRLSIA